MGRDGTTADWERWRERYGDWYSSDEERDTAFADYLRNRDDVRRAFGA